MGVGGGGSKGDNSWAHTDLTSDTGTLSTGNTLPLLSIPLQRWLNVHTCSVGCVQALRLLGNLLVGNGGVNPGQGLQGSGVRPVCPH